MEGPEKIDKWLHVWSEAERERRIEKAERAIGLNGSKRMQFTFFCHVRNMRILGGIKQPKDVLNAITHNGCAPPLALNARDIRCTNQSAFAASPRVSSVFGVLLPRCCAKIRNPVVGSDPVYVVDLGIGESAVKKSPRNAMRIMPLPPKSNCYISIFGHVPGNGAFPYIRPTLTPRNDPCIRVVYKSCRKMIDKICVHFGFQNKKPAPDRLGTVQVESPASRTEEAGDNGASNVVMLPLVP